MDRLGEFPRTFYDGREFTQSGGWRERLGLGAGACLVVDMGCNDGTLLAAAAQRHREAGFVGVDWSPRLLFHAGRRVAGDLLPEGGGRGSLEDVALSNVALVHGRAQEMERMFGGGEVDEVWLFQPEPMQLNTRVATRLFDEVFLLSCGKVLKRGGRVTLKTDHAGYYQWACAILGVVPASAFAAQERGERKAKRKEILTAKELPGARAGLRGRFRVAVNSADYWNDPVALEDTKGRAYFGVESTYERRFKAKGLPIYLVELRAES